MEEKYLKGNKLIAEFRFPNAIEEYESGEINVKDGILHIGTLIFGQFELMKYHSSWDWLMPVVEKIESEYHCEIHIYSHHNCQEPYRCHIIDWEENEIIRTSSNSKIEGVFDLVVEFIEWYNEDIKK